MGARKRVKSASRGMNAISTQKLARGRVNEGSVEVGIAFRELDEAEIALRQALGALPDD